MIINLHDLFLAPGDLAALFTSCGIEVSPESPIAGSPLLAPPASARLVAEIAPGVDVGEFNVALQALAMPALVIAGLRGVRRLPPWPFFIFRRTGGPAVVLAPEGNGFTRLRFPYSDEELIDWPRVVWLSCWLWRISFGTAIRIWIRIGTRRSQSRSRRRR